MTTDLHDAPAAPATTEPPARRRRAGSTRRGALVAAAAAIVVVALGVTQLRPGGTPTAEASQILAAAETLSEFDALRAEMTVLVDGEVVETLEGEFSGEDARVVSRPVDGSAVYEFRAVGDTMYDIADGEVTSTMDLTAVDRLNPFGEASARVLEAALAGDEIADLGEDDVAGVTADHYRIDLTDASRNALEALSPADLAWFELEYPGEVSTIEVWVADDLIQQIAVTSSYDTRVSRYFAFGEPLTIEAP